MRFWTGFTPFEFVVYTIGAVSIIVLTIMANTEQLTGLRNLRFKKIAWGVLGVVVVYWALSVPNAAPFERDLSSRLRLEADLESTSPETKYIHDHHNRIEELEHEAQQARRDLRALNEHYRRLIQLLFAGVFVYAASFILAPRRSDDGDQVKLGLDEQ